MSTCARGRPRVLTRRHLLRIVVINLIAATGAVAVVAWFGLLSHLSDVGYALATSLIYAYTIGSLSGTILPVIAISMERQRPMIRFIAFGGAIVALTIIGCIVGSVILVLVHVNTVAGARAAFSLNVRISVTIALVAGLAMFGYETLRARLHAAELAQARAEKLAAEARFSSLESRIRPHFLFNTLNSVSALIQEDPAKAEETVGRLAALLRFSLDANQRSRAPLEQELKIVRDYLEIEKTRFGDRLRYSIDAPEALCSVQIPLLTIQTLVENSIKHVIARRREGGEISVRVRRANGSLAVDVADSGPGFSLTETPAEHGLDNLIARLHALYAGDATVETIVDEKGRAAVCVRFPVPAS